MIEGTRPMHIFFTILGVILLMSEIVALRYVNRTMKKGSFNREWRKARVISYFSGVAIGVILVAFSYYPKPDVRIMGFPFLSAVFELHNGAWVHFFGANTLPAVIANFVVGLLLPQLFFAVLVGRHVRKGEAVVTPEGKSV